MIENLLIFIISLFLVLRGATLATKYASKLAASYKLSSYTIGFIVVAFISILPETFIAINSSVEGIPSFGLGTLFGSNIADLTLIFAIIVIYTGRKIRITSPVLKSVGAYPFLIFLPFILGNDGYFSRIDGIALVTAGAAYFYASFKGSVERPSHPHTKERARFFIMLFGSMAMLLIGSHFTVTSAVTLAEYIGVSPTLIGILVVGLGTTLPELFFALKSTKEHQDSLAVGDILGTVLADATIVVGILALVQPFGFEVKIIYVAGLFMLAASILLVYFMRTGKVLSLKEALILILFWVGFVMAEFLVNA